MRIAVCTMGVKLPGETRGYTRFRKLCELLVVNGFEVDLITTNFQHWEKLHRDTSLPQYQNQPYNIVFIEEPGYKKNVDPARISSHRAAAQHLAAYFREHEGYYDAIYTEIPPNDVARACADAAHRQGIPFIIDVNDLWPEAMYMALNVPVLSNILFHPFSRDAKAVYRAADFIVGTSDEYAARPLKDRTTPCETLTVYVGNDLSQFDRSARLHISQLHKPKDEIWVTYAGTLGTSYDLETLISALSELSQKTDAPIRAKILGDGPKRDELLAQVQNMSAPVDILGYQPYETMAAYLCASDIVINSLVKDAPQSIVTKIGDYLASSSALINTGSSPEFRALVEKEGVGLNVEPENSTALADAILSLVENETLRRDMSIRARDVAERDFDQNTSYLRIVQTLRRLIEENQPNRTAHTAR